MRVTTLLVSLFILKALSPFFDNFAVLANDAVAERIQVRVQDLPEPFETPSASNGPIIIERPPAANLRVPAGFKVNPFAEDLKRPRWMAIAPNGDVFLTEYKSDEIIVLRDSDDDGTADVRSVYLSGLHHPHGLAFHGGYLYIGETTQIRRVRYKNGALETSELVETVTPKGSLGDGKGHWTRNIVFAPDGSHFYVAIGSRSNRKRTVRADEFLEEISSSTTPISFPTNMLGTPLSRSMALGMHLLLPVTRLCGCRSLTVGLRVGMRTLLLAFASRTDHGSMA